eukprot:CAMPEP_0198289374 /NCGR_PEP_ID=MMETSP1449-20131203/7566_1 /TAXON_ID=420275 /ORGANISM="Attheya septentrionalis, Strain CCMP2084" /LENGTH=395 /DNA_ID=CAMNT_0043987683 /DNA_START=57 /DNA_END=1244 /DNA_ORIENTATION=-
MLFRSALTLALVSSATAGSAPLINTGASEITSQSKFGKKLMANARRLNNNNNYEDDGTWMVDYSIRFDKCHTQMMLMGDDARRRLNDNAEESSFRMGHYVEFSVCPTSKCSSSSTSGCAQYLTSMAEFVDAYTESKMEEQERMCENIRENCVCYDDGDDEACESHCYTDAGASECVEVEDENEEDFEIQEFLECQEIENNGGNNNNGNYNQLYYVGPYCTNNGKSITLGVFTDEQCSQKTDNSIYATYNYGKTLPYSSQSLVAHDCISCEEEQEADENENGNYNNYNDQYQEREIKQLCEEVREDAAACEQNLGSSGPYYKNNQACNYIHNILPKLDSVFQSAGVSGSSGSSGNAAKAFAWIFALGCVGLGGYVYFLHQKMDKKIDLSEQGGVSA